MAAFPISIKFDKRKVKRKWKQPEANLVMTRCEFVMAIYRKCGNGQLKGDHFRN
jgi:hypothetical protein